MPATAELFLRGKTRGLSDDPSHSNFISRSDAGACRAGRVPGRHGRRGKNIVALEPEFLGVGCGLSRDEKGFDTIYADQDFFAPLPDAPAAPAP